MPLPRIGVDLSALCDCGISWSYSLIFPPPNDVSICVFHTIFVEEESITFSLFNHTYIGTFKSSNVQYKLQCVCDCCLVYDKYYNAIVMLLVLGHVSLIR